MSLCVNEKTKKLKWSYHCVSGVYLSGTLVCQSFFHKTAFPRLKVFFQPRLTVFGVPKGVSIGIYSLPPGL